MVHKHVLKAKQVLLNLIEQRYGKVKPAPRRRDSKSLDSVVPAHGDG